MYPNPYLDPPPPKTHSFSHSDKDSAFDKLNTFIGMANPTIGLALKGATLASSYFGSKGQRKEQRKMFEDNLDFQRSMSNTAHQRQMIDLQRAGLNPILSAKYGGASTPAGGSYQPQNKALQMAQTMHAMSSASQAMSNAELQKQEVDWYRKQGYPKSDGTQKPINTFFSQYLAQMSPQHKKQIFSEITKLMMTSAKGVGHVNNLLKGNVKVDEIPFVKGNQLDPIRLLKSVAMDERLEPYYRSMLFNVIKHALSRGIKISPSFNYNLNRGKGAWDK